MKNILSALGSISMLVTLFAACSGTSPESGDATGVGGIGNQGGTTSHGNSIPTGGTASPGSISVTGGTASQAGNATGNAGTRPADSGGSVSVPADCRVEGDGKTTLVFVNRCVQSVAFRGSDVTGGVLAPGALACVDVGSATEAISSKRYWGYSGDDPGAGRYTLAEFTFNSDFYDLDWYDISHVDAHNLPMAILPAARPKCRQLSCPQDFLASCPTVGQYRDASGQIVSCVSPNRDDPNNAVVLLFEQCDDAYAWSGDDQKGTDVSPMVGCEVEDFDIVFCPEAP